jgi:hypothetical protein
MDDRRESRPSARSRLVAGYSWCSSGIGISHGLNVHLARHTFATELRCFAGIDAASQALGHADLNMTLGSTATATSPASRSLSRRTRFGSNSNGATQSFLPKLTLETAPLSHRVEAAGIEPA